MVLLVVLATGARLITLGVRAHAEERRTTAVRVVKQNAERLQRELPRLQSEGGNASTRGASRLASSQVLKSLAQSGYDFEVSEVDPANRFRQVLLRSQTATLTKAESADVRPPQGFLPDDPQSTIELSIAPRDGWYPTRDLATSIGFLAVIA